MPGLQAADHQDGEEGEQDGEADQWDEGRGQTDGPPVAAPIGLALLAEPFEFPCLCGVALDRQHAPQVVSQAAGQIAGAVPHVAVAGLQPFLKGERSPQNHRDGQEGHPCHQRREPGHGASHRQHRGDQLQDFVRPVVEESLQLVDVVVENCEQPATAAGFKEAHFQLLQMAVGLQTQLVLHGLGQVAPQQGIEVFE